MICCLSKIVRVHAVFVQVKASLGMNVFSAVTAGLAIPLMSVQLAVISMMDPSLYAEVLQDILCIHVYFVFIFY